MVRLTSSAALVVALAALAACGVVPPPIQQVQVCPVTPPPQVETIPPPRVAGTAQTWEPGHWGYAGNQFVWESGRYIPGGPGHTAWIPGSFTLGQGSACVWVPAHWAA